MDIFFIGICVIVNLKRKKHMAEFFVDGSLHGSHIMRIFHILCEKFLFLFFFWKVEKW